MAKFLSNPLNIRFHNCVVRVNNNNIFFVNLIFLISKLLLVNSEVDNDNVELIFGNTSTYQAGHHHYAQMQGVENDLRLNREFKLSGTKDEPVLFSGIPPTLCSNLISIRMDHVIFNPGSTLVEALQGCTKLQEILLHDIQIQPTWSGFGNHSIFLPNLKTFDLTSNSIGSMSKANHLREVLFFYKGDPSWSISEIHELGVNIRVARESTNLEFAIKFELQHFPRTEINVYNIHNDILDLILIGCCIRGNFYLEALSMTTPPSTPLPRLNPATIPNALKSLKIKSGFVTENEIQEVLSKLSCLEHFELDFDWKAFKLPINMNDFVSSSLMTLRLVYTNIQQTDHPLQFQQTQSLEIINSTYGLDFIESFNGKFQYVESVQIVNDFERPKRDIKFLRQIIETQASEIQYSPFTQSGITNSAEDEEFRQVLIANASFINSRLILSRNISTHFVSRPAAPSNICSRNSGSHKILTFGLSKHGSVLLLMYTLFVIMRLDTSDLFK